MLDLDSTTNQEEHKTKEAAQHIENARKHQRPQKRAASPGLEEAESFSNFVSTKSSLGKQAAKPKPLFSQNASNILEDILNESNIILEEEDELTTFTQQSEH